MFGAKQSSLVSLLLSPLSITLSRWLSSMESYLVAELTTISDTNTSIGLDGTGCLALLVSRSDYAKRFVAWLSSCLRAKQVLSLPAFIKSDMCICLTKCCSSIEMSDKLLQQEIQLRNGPSSLLGGWLEWLEVVSQTRKAVSSGQSTNLTNWTTLYQTDFKTNSSLFGFDTQMRSGLLLRVSNQRAFVCVALPAERRSHSDMPMSRPSMQDGLRPFSYNRSALGWASIFGVQTPPSFIPTGGTG